MIGSNSTGSAPHAIFIVDTIVPCVYESDYNEKWYTVSVYL